MNRTTSWASRLVPSTLTLWACRLACWGAVYPVAAWGGEAPLPATATPGASNPAASTSNAEPSAEGVLVDDRRGSRPAERAANDADQYGASPVESGPWGGTDQTLAVEALRLRDARGSIVPSDWGAYEGNAPVHDTPWVDGPSQGEPVRGAADRQGRGAPWSPQRPPRPIHWTHAPPAVAPDASMSLIDALRQAAIQFDATANRLEAYELYEQADAVRRTAQELRTKARAVRQGENEAGPSRTVNAAY